MRSAVSKRVDFPIVGSFNEDPVTKVDAQRTINMYEVFDQEGKKPRYLTPWPGLKREGTFSEGANGRAAITFQGSTETQRFAYFVVREDIYRVDTALTITRISDVVNKFITQIGHVGIAANENEIAFVDNSRLLIWDSAASTLTDETSTLPAGVSPLDITFMDGYFILVNGASTNKNRFYISALESGTTWDVLDFALVNSRPTVLTACSVLKRRVFLFGQEKSEIWLDAGTADFPFRRDNNLLLEHGIKAAASLSEGFDRLFYLANDVDGVGGVMMVMGTFPKKVSTREVDQVIQTLSKPEDATGFVFKINGQIFYQINFTDAERTFVYNASTNRWNELEMLDGTRHIANAHAFFNDKHFVLSYNEDLLFELNEAFVDIDRTDPLFLPFTPIIENIKRTRIARVMSVPTYDRIRIDRFQVDMLQGVGVPNTKGPDFNPEIFLSISEDGGITYHNFDRRPVGPAGARLTRTIWRRLGVRRDAILRVEMFNRVQYFILGAAIDVEVLPE